MMWGYYYNQPGMLAWMIISSVIWLALVGIAVWAFVSWARSRSRIPPSRPFDTTASGPSAQEILRQRYARGEIDLATFRQMQTELEATGGDAASSRRLPETTAP
ncbi:MAG TPA: hypothetical protein VF812_14180 [Ktedonobacterales bacterium]